MLKSKRMDEPKPKLDPQIVHMIHQGESSVTILDRMRLRYAAVSYPPRQVYFHSLLIHAIRSLRPDLIQTCYNHEEYDRRRVRMYLGSHLLSPVWEASLVNDQRILNTVMEHEKDMTEQFRISVGGRVYTISPLYAAIRAERFDVFVKFFEAQSRLEPSRELRCLHEACVHVSRDFVAKLLQHGTISGELNTLDSEGHTPLCIAASHNAPILPLLLGAGSDPNLECKDGETVLHALCRAIGRGRVRGPEADQFVRLLLDGAKLRPDSTRCSALRTLCGDRGYSGDQTTNYRRLIKMLSIRSCEKNKRGALLDVLGNLYYILCLCLANVANPMRLSASLSIQSQQIRMWLLKTRTLMECGADPDSSCWRLVLAAVEKANRSCTNAFKNKPFFDAYRYCLHVVDGVLRMLPPPDTDPEFSVVKDHLLVLIICKPELYLRFLCAYMEISSVSCNIKIITNLLEKVNDTKDMNNKDPIKTVLEHLVHCAFSLKFIVKKCIVSHLGRDNIMEKVQQLCLPNSLQDYLMKDEVNLSDFEISTQDL